MRTTGKRQIRQQIVQGMTLSTLMSVLARNGFRVDSPYLGRLAYLMVMGVVNHVYGECEDFVCDQCLESHECGEEMVLDVVNSPRMGVCGYVGPDTADDWALK